MARRPSKKKMRQQAFTLTVVLLIIVALLLVALAALAFGNEALYHEIMGFLFPDGNTPTTTQPKYEIPTPEGSVAVYFIDVGQADATLIVAPTGEKMLIDAGKELYSNYPDADNYFSEHGITELDYLVFTHYDYDHIGSGSAILELCQVDNVIYYDYEPESATGKNLVTAIESEPDCNRINPQRGYTFTMGGIFFEILSEKTTEDNLDSNENENSVCLMMTYGDTKFLFTGDAEVEREEELIGNYGSALDADVFQAGHHGAANANTEAFMDLVTPDYAIFSCGTGNSYGHPTAEAMDHIDDHAETILRTDLQGTIILYTDGTAITYTVEKSGTASTWINSRELFSSSLFMAA